MLFIYNLYRIFFSRKDMISSWNFRIRRRFHQFFYLFLILSISYLTRTSCFIISCWCKMKHKSLQHYKLSWNVRHRCDWLIFWANINLSTFLLYWIFNYQNIYTTIFILFLLLSNEWYLLFLLFPFPRFVTSENIFFLFLLDLLLPVSCAE